MRLAMLKKFTTCTYVYDIEVPLYVVIGSSFLCRTEFGWEEGVDKWSEEGSCCTYVCYYYVQ